jgi:hypothetical protein
MHNVQHLESRGLTPYGESNNNQREIPLECSYIIGPAMNENNIKRDKLYPNRYWLSYPPEWRTSSIKERIIGFRLCDIIRAKRALKFTINIYDKNTKVLKTSTNFEFFLNYNDNTNAILNEINKKLNDVFDMSCSASFSFEDYYPNSIVGKGKHWCAYSTPVNEINDNSIYDKYKQMIRIKLNNTNELFNFTNMNTDTKNVLNAQDYNETDSNLQYGIIEFLNVWDRDPCILKSNVVGGIMDNYVGCIAFEFKEIKHYKIYNDDDKFYVELFYPHLHTVTSTLPFDDLDVLILELTFSQ